MCSIFPNPSTGKINIELTSNIQTQNFRYEVINISGVYISSSQQQTSRIYTPEVSNLSKGMY